jgi:hypothetical protein
MCSGGTAAGIVMDGVAAGIGTVGICVAGMGLVGAGDGTVLDGDSIAAQSLGFA